MRVLVCGGRDFYDFATLIKVLNALHSEFRFSELVSGDASGADQLAGRWSRYHWATDRILELKYPADWKRFGRAAGSKRNQQMLDEAKPDLVVAFPGGAGTADMVRRARVAKVRVIEVGKDGTLTGK